MGLAIVILIFIIFIVFAVSHSKKDSDIMKRHYEERQKRADAGDVMAKKEIADEEMYDPTDDEPNTDIDSL